MRILVVEDETKMAAALKRGLEAEGYEVTVAHTGEDGFFLLNEDRFDLLLLDLMLPGRDGIEILSALRKRGVRTPVLILTARDGIDDLVLGLDSGADDYLVKPFAFPELLARVRALGRRGPSEEGSRLSVADLEVDMTTRDVTRAGRAIDLTPKEYDLLHYLLRNRGHIVSREMLARDVWHETSRATPIDNVIDVHMSRLRRKLDDPFKTKLLTTVRGVGFLLSEGRQA